MKTLITLSIILTASLCYGQGYQYQYQNGENIYQYQNDHQGGVYNPETREHETNTYIVIVPQQPSNNSSTKDDSDDAYANDAYTQFLWSQLHSLNRR